MSSLAMRVASAPVSFGVDEVMMDDAWMPTPDDMLDWMVDIGYEGTELGPPGFLGDAAELRERLSSRGLAFIGSFMPQHFSRAEKADADRAWLRENLRLVRDGAPAGSQPLAILSDHFDEADRRRWSGRIGDHPETWLSAERFEVFMDNLHRGRRDLPRGGARTGPPSPRRDVRRDGRRDRPGDGPDRPVARRPVPGHRPLPVRRGRPGEIGRRLRRPRPPRPHQGLQDVGHRRASNPDDKGLETALKRGVFCPFGEGDVDIEAVIAALLGRDYRGWLVVEQDQALGTSDTPASVIAGQRFNLEYLRRFGG